MFSWWSKIRDASGFVGVPPTGASGYRLSDANNDAQITIGPGLVSVAGPAAPVVVQPQDASEFTVGPRSGSHTSTIGPTISRPITVQPIDVPGVMIRPTAAIPVQPPQRGSWDEQGWRRARHGRQEVFEGDYQVLDPVTAESLRYAGRVVIDRGIAVPYIANPPTAVKRHAKGPCFQLVDAPWFRVNWHRPARNVDDAILYVQKILDEALNRHR